MGHKLRNQRWTPNQGEGSGLLRGEMEHWGWEAGRFSKKAELIPEVGRQIFSWRGYDPEGEELLKYLGDLQLQPQVGAAIGCRKWVPKLGAASGCRVPGAGYRRLGLPVIEVTRYIYIIILPRDNKTNKTNIQSWMRFINSIVSCLNNY